MSCIPKFGRLWVIPQIRRSKSIQRRFHDPSQLPDSVFTRTWLSRHLESLVVAYLSRFTKMVSFKDSEPAFSDIFPIPINEIEAIVPIALFRRK